MRIVQMSDIHVGKSAFSAEMLEAVVRETNALEPDLVAVGGDLTMQGHRWEFEEAKSYLDRLECEDVVVVPGNHDAKNAGYRHFEAFFGNLDRVMTVESDAGVAKVVAIDSTEPDLTEGRVGRHRYGWIDAAFRGWDEGPKIVVLHHHILAVPGTGRDSGILSDAGDVMAIFRELGVDLVLSGHRHVPYLWTISGTRIVHSGTASSERTRGDMPPSYNVIDFGAREVTVTMKQPGKGKEGEEVLATYTRDSAQSVELRPEFERFVRYYDLPS